MGQFSEDKENILFWIGNTQSKGKTNLFISNTETLYIYTEDKEHSKSSRYVNIIKIEVQSF